MTANGYVPGQQPAGLFGAEWLKPKAPSLADRFVVPPFSVLDARQGYWQERKRAWLGLGIQSELGRGDDLSESGPGAVYNGKSQWSGNRGPSAAVPGGAGANSVMLGGRMGQAPNGLAAKRQPTTYNHGPARKFGQDLMRGEHEVGANNGLLGISEQARRLAGGYSGEDGALKAASGTSVFDPVLCELAYRWFCPLGGAVLDPFAGGSVRGIVAALLGYAYTGVDLRPEQIAANEAQAAAITPANLPRWIAGDSRNLGGLVAGPFDLLFTCPPYFDLEQYSSSPADLSNAGSYAAFQRAYRYIVGEAADLLKPNRFACVVVGDIRDALGTYRGFVMDTIAAFRQAGMGLYNEAVLVTSVGSLPLRIGKQFGRYRKLGKAHQNVLVFYKGDQRAIPAELGVAQFAADGVE